MSVSCRAHGCIFLSFLLKRQKITTVGSELPENITFQGKRQKKSAMGRSVPKRWAQVDFTGGNGDEIFQGLERFERQLGESSGKERGQESRDEQGK